MVRKEMFNNDALNTFYLQLYGIGHMAKDHSDSESGNRLPPLHGLLFSISNKGSFIFTIPQKGYTSRGALAGTRNRRGNIVIGANPITACI